MPETDANTPAVPTWTPPYIAWRNLLNLIERLETDAPPRIDRSFLSGSNGARTSTINALRSLGLISPDGSLTERMRELVGAGANRPKVVRSIVEESYAEPVRLSQMNATSGQLEKAFEDYGISGATKRKAIAFFLRAAAYAGIPLSKHFKAPSSTNGLRPRQPRKARGRPSGNGSELPTPLAPTPTQETSAAGQRARYIDMLIKRAEGQTEQMDADLLNRIERLLELPTEPQE